MAPVAEQAKSERPKMPRRVTRLPARSASADRVWRARLPRDAGVINAAGLDLMANGSVLLPLLFRDGVDGFRYVDVELRGQRSAQRDLRWLRNDNYILRDLAHCGRVLDERGFLQARGLAQVVCARALLLAGPPGLLRPASSTPSFAPVHPEIRRTACSLAWRGLGNTGGEPRVCVARLRVQGRTAASMALAARGARNV